MYCTHCGKELEEDAKFCERCGAKVVHEIVAENSHDPKSESIESSLANKKEVDVQLPNNPQEAPSESGKRKILQPGSIDDDQDSSLNVYGADAEAINVNNDSSNQSTLKAAVASNRKRSHRRMPLIFVVALVLALTASVALAAYYVYTEIYLPQQEAQQQEEAAQLTETDNGYIAQGEVNAPEATGEPENVLQIAEILAMSPEGIPGYLESQGLTVVQHEGGEPLPADVPSEYVEESYTFWGIPYESEILTSIDPEGTVLPNNEELMALGNDEYASPMGISLGDSIINTMHTIDKTTFFTDNDLGNGETPNSANLYLSFNEMPSDEQLSDLADICGFGTPLAISSTDAVENDRARDSFYFEYKFAAGFISINGADYIWYITVDGISADSTYRIGIGCIPEQTAENLVVYTDLYDIDTWQSADNNTKSLMFSQTLLQNSNTGNGGLRTNILTGEDEVAYSEYDPATGTYTADQWLTAEEYQQLTGDNPETYGFVYENGQWIQPYARNNY